MNEHSTESVLSALLRANSPSGSTQGLVDAMLTIQTQLSVIQENQRKIMKTLRDLKRSTQVLLKDTHHAISNQLDELQDSVDEQHIENETPDAFDIDLFK